MPPRDMQISVVGLDRAVKRLQNPEAFRVPMRRFFTKATGAGVVEVRKRTPRWRGQAQESIKAEIDSRPIPLWGRIVSRLWYMRMLERGTRAHFPKIDGRLAQWAFDHGVDPTALAFAMARGKGRGKRRKATRGRLMFFRGRKVLLKTIPGMVEITAREIARRLERG